MKEFLDKYMPPDHSAHGPQLDHLSYLVHWLMAVLFVAWGAYFLFVLWRFRASRNGKASYQGMRSHFSSYAEAGVAVFEAVLLVGFSIPIWIRWTRPPEPSQNPLEVRVVAEQFAWNIHYPGADKVFGKSDVKLVSSSNPLGLDMNDPAAKDDIVTLNQLHMQVDRPVVVRLSSKDVIHSFFLPYLRVKQDAIPGQEFAIHFTPKKTGEQGFEIACAQLCGLGHYRMRGQYAVHGRADFEKWLAENAPRAEVAATSQPAAASVTAPETIRPTT